MSSTNEAEHLLAIARSNLVVTHRVANMAEMHLKIVERNGSVILYGVKPRTSPYVLERDKQRLSNSEAHTINLRGRTNDITSKEGI